MPGLYEPKKGPNCFIFYVHLNFMLNCVEHEKRFITSVPGIKVDSYKGGIIAQGEK